MKGYCFIDMHIHSMFSNEEGVTQTPKNILNATLELIEDYKAKTLPTIKKFLEERDPAIEIAAHFMFDNNDEVVQLVTILRENCSNDEKAKQILDKFSRACISITDHNSVLGSLEAIRLINENPEKYANIDFIPGVEFNAGLKNLRLNQYGQSVYSKCHLLGYGFDIEDENLKIFSKLYQLTLGSEKINIGQAISASRNAFRMNYNVSIPLSAFKGLLERAIPFERCSDANLGRIYTSIRNEFLNICASYLPRNRNITDFDNTIKNTVFPDQPVKVNDNAGHGKLPAVEIIKTIKNAGGKTSLAHPSMISKEKRIYRDPGMVETIVSDVVKLLQQLTNNGLDALEIMHKSNVPVIEALLNVAKKFGLYITAGSDCHNHSAQINNQIYRGKGYISDCFNDLYHQISAKDYNLDNAPKAFNKVVFLPIIKLIHTNTHDKDRQNCKIRDGKTTTYSRGRLKSISNRVFIYRQTRRMPENAGQRAHDSRESSFEEELRNLTSEPIVCEDTEPSNLWRTQKTWMEELEELRNSLQAQENNEADKKQTIKVSNNNELSD